MSTVFRWSPYFENGFDDIDGEHQSLVDMINRVGIAITEGQPDPALIDGFFDELVEYAGLHFANEEDLMAKHGLDSEFVVAHLRQHRDFTREVAALRAQAAGNAGDSLAIVQFLANWLTFHILGTDRSMADQIYLVESGWSPRDAFRQARKPHDASVVRPLLEALLTLYQLVAGRGPAQAGSSESAAANRPQHPLGRAPAQSGAAGSDPGGMQAYVDELLGLIDAYGELEPERVADPAVRTRLVELRQWRQDVIRVSR